MTRTNSISLSRQFWLGALATLALGFFALAPNTLAANDIAWNGSHAAQYNLYTGTDYTVPVKVTTVNLNNNLTFSVAKSGQGMLYTQISTYPFQVGFSPNKDFKWDGKLGGNYVAPGTYSIKVVGTNANNEVTTLTDTVEVTEEAKIFPIAPATWNKDSGVNYKIGYELSTVLPACLFLSVDGTVVKMAGPFNTSSGELTWDGKINGAMVAVGNHNWEIDIDSSTQCAGQAKVANAATGNVNVTQNAVVIPSPTLSNMGVSVSPFSPNADGDKDNTTISFKMAADAKVTVTVENSQNVVVRTLMNAVSKTSGTIETVWNGKDTGGSVVGDGTYKVVVMADNDAPGNSTASTSVVVDNPADPIPAPNNNCAGFTDLSKNFADCNVVTWVKDKGIMTGNADGTFDPSGILQRDQVAKISLETFGLFDKNKDYCGGQSAFPDVSKVAWSYQYLCRGVQLGMITGYKSGVDAGKYIPSRGVSRVESYALIFRNLADTMPSNSDPSYKDVPLNEWFTGFAKYAWDHSLFAGNYLYPSEQVTRLEMAQTLYKLNQQGKL